MALCHCCIYTFLLLLLRLFLRTNVSAHRHISLYLSSILLLRPYLRTILPHTAYRISPVPANDFILRMSHITSRNTTLPPCLIPLMSHITSHHIRQRHYAAPCRIPLLLLRPSKKTTLVPYVCIDTYPTPFPIIFTWVSKGCKLLGRWNHLLMVIR